MGCRYEEEIFERTGRMDKCGCPTCPYKTESECYEINIGEVIYALQLPNHPCDEKP
jgi:hypothetical protein